MTYRLISICLLLFLLTIFLFADRDDDIAGKINLLLEEDLEDNYDEINTLSEDIKYGTAYRIYVLNQKEISLPLALNSITGFGIGSFVQGDKRGALTTLLGDLFFVGVFTISYYLEYNYSPMTLATANTLFMCQIGSLIGLVIIRIYEIIRPIKYANSYNKRLYSVLNLDRDYNEDSVSIRSSLKRRRNSS